MKKRWIIGLLCTSVMAVIVVQLQREVDAVSCVSPYAHRSYLIYGIEKHSCVKSSTGSGIFDWGFWGISKKSLKGGLGLQVQYFGTEDPGDGSCAPTLEDPTDPDCLIRGVVFCCNGGGQCGGQGQPFLSGSLSALALLQPGDCDSTGKCRDIITLDVDDDELICPNRNWGGTFTPEEMYVQSCTCDTGFDAFGQCSVTPSCNVELCTVDLTDYRPGIKKDYACELVQADAH